MSKDRTVLSGNLRIALESYIQRRHKNKYKLYYYKDGARLPDVLLDELEKHGVKVLQGFNLHTIWHILTSGTIVLSHNPRDVHISKKCKKRKIINLWHGVAIKKIELLMNEVDDDKRQLMLDNSGLYDMIIASSEQDKLTNIKAFGVMPEKVKITGLPRYEILKPNYKARSLLKEEERSLLALKGEKKLVLFAPTFREKYPSAIEQLTLREWQTLERFAKENNILLGVRRHPYDKTPLPKEIRQSESIRTFDVEVYTEPNIILKHTDVLVVDYSSIWVDYLLLHRPIIGFSKDYQYYLEKERGFVYDFHTIFPGRFTMSVDELIKEISRCLKCSKISYKKALEQFHAYDLETDFKQIIYDAIEEIRR